MTWTDDLDPLVPASDGPAGQGDDEIRLIKQTLVTTWPDLDVEITMGTAGAAPTSADVTQLWDDVTALAGGVAGVFTPGQIMMWSTANGGIPTDWAVCDGNNVNGVQVPDLTNNFIVAAGGTYADGSTGGSSTTGLGGTHSHTTAAYQLVMGDLPSSMGGNISLTMSTGVGGENGIGHTTKNYVAGGDAVDADGTSTNPVTVSGANDDGHTHGNTGSEPGHTHSGNIPPYYALTYIIYVGPTP
jgi:hypothetical protein